jgi:hypothetical protein
MTQTRRAFVRTIPGFGAFALLQQLPQADTTWPVLPPAGAPVDDAFPSHHPALVREFVGASHGNISRVKELIATHPELAKAAWDWGYGDWETALGAASHVGNRPIAELLLEHGAPPTLFSAAMLGQLDAVKALITAAPGLQRTRGPHGLTLMLHARNGGAQSAPVVAYLESIGDADLPYRNEPLAPEVCDAMVGHYVFGERPRDRFIVTNERTGLMIARAGATPRNLFHQGDLAFHVSGGTSVRIRFERQGGAIAALTINSPDPVVRARRMSGTV